MNYLLQVKCRELPVMMFLVLMLITRGAYVVSAQQEKEGTARPPCITKIGMIAVDPCNNSFSFPATVNMSSGLIEVAICTISGKTHESVFVTDVDPISFEAALTLIGCIKTKDYKSQVKKPEDVFTIKHSRRKPDRVEIYVEYRDSLNKDRLARIEDFIWDASIKAPMARCYWHFKGVPVDDNENPIPYSGNNLVVSFIEMDAILEMDTPMLFDDNYLYANNHSTELFANKNVIIHIKLVK